MESISFLFEVMKGCQMGCKGCRIRKESTDIPTDVDLDRMISMFGDLKNEHQIELNEIEIGPSDIFSAVNKEEIFTNPKLTELVNLFKTMSVNASFIYPDEERYVWLAEQVSKYTCSDKVGVVVPIEMEHVFNDKYLNRIKENMKRFYDSHGDRRYRTSLNIIYDERFIQNPLNKFSYDKLFQKTNSFVKDLFFAHCNVRVDFVFHHGRDNLDNPFIVESFRKALDDLNKQYFIDHEQNNGVVIDGVPSFLNFDFENDELIYHDGKLYIRPIMNDRINIFHDKLLYKGEWTARGLLEHVSERFHGNLMKAIEIKDCESCSRISDCARRFTHDVMDILKTEDCLPLLKQYEKQ